MTAQALETITRRASEISRRGSFATLGGVGLAALTGSSAKAGKSAKKCKKKCEKKVEQKCQSLEGECNEFLATQCSIPGVPEDCAEILGACCELLGECEVASFLECFLEATDDRRPV